MHPRQLRPALCLTLTALLLASCSPKKSVEKALPAKASTAYSTVEFDAFMAEFAAPEPEFQAAGPIAEGDNVLVNYNEVATVTTLDPTDDELKVELLESGHETNVRQNQISPRNNGAAGLWEGKLAITNYESSPVRVKMTFDNGYALARVIPNRGQIYDEVFHALTPEKSGDYAGKLVVDQFGEMLEIKNVFADGRVYATAINDGDEKIVSKVMPEKDGTGGVFVGKRARRTIGGDIFTVVAVFADGRVAHWNSRYTEIVVESGMTPWED